MAFGFRAGEDLRFSFLPPSSAPAPAPAPASATASASDGYFAAQALRAGLFGVGGGDAGRVDLVPPPIPAREALQQELQRERIREEIRVREIAQSRIVDEEVRREMEFKRTMAMRRHEAERFTLLHVPPLHPDLVPERRMPFIPEARFGEWLRPGPVPHRPEVEFNARLPPPLESRVGERLGPGLVPHHPQAGFVERLRFPPHPKPVLRKKPPVPRRKPEFTEKKTPRPKLAGTKRKAAVTAAGPAGLSQKDKKKWSCALCEVSTTGEQGLKEHLQGKKHKAKEESLGTAKEESLGTAKEEPTEKKPSGSTPPAKEADIKMSPAKVEPSNDLTKKKTSEGKQQQPSEEKQQFWCELCKVKCNSQVMLTSHLNGKKHKTQLEESGNPGATSAAKPDPESDSKPALAAKPAIRRAKKQKKQTAKKEDEVKGEAAVAEKASDVPDDSTEAAVALEAAKEVA